MNKKNTIITTLIFLTTFTAYTCIVAYHYPNLLNETRFQDLFAGITALFSGLAFLGVICAILLQKDELSLQRKELELTRRELKRTAKAQEKSEQALSKQAASLKITAKLNGLSAILQHHNSLIEITNSAKFGIDTVAFNKSKQDAEGVISEIKQLIQDK